MISALKCTWDRCGEHSRAGTIAIQAATRTGWSRYQDDGAQWGDVCVSLIRQWC